MNKLRVVTWNAEGMFVKNTKTQRASPHDALAVLKRLQADIVVIPEFGKLRGLKPAVATTIAALGYEMVLVPYEDERAPGLGFAILSRLSIISKEHHLLAGSSRSLIELIVEDEHGNRIRVIGLHLDDRAEAIRMKQITSVVKVVNSRSEFPTLVMGDFNAMHYTSLFARMVRSRLAGLVTSYIPHTKLSSIAARVREMAVGTTVSYLLAHTDLCDLDPRLQRTISAKQADLSWAPKTRLAKIDWIFGPRHWKVQRYHIGKDAGSDHRPVIADVIYA